MLHEMAALNTTILPYTNYSLLNLNDTSGLNLTNRPGICGGSKDYDAEGALKFTVAVVLVYGVAVMGVFVLGYFGRKRRNNAELDQQANNFLRNLEQVRYKLEKDKQVGNVKNFLRSYSYRLSADGDTDRGQIVTTSLITENERTGGSPLNSNSSKVSRNLSEGLSPLHEGPEEEEEDDNVFMTEEERQRYGVDMYMNVRESDIC